MERNAKEKYELYAHTLRGLINYHKRMMMMSACYNPDTNNGEAVMCPKAEANNGECPKTSVYNDVYLGALEEALRLIEERISRLNSLT